MYLNTISIGLPSLCCLLPICWPYSISSHWTTENKAFFLFSAPVFTSPVNPSSPRPSSRLRLARRPVFASPVVPSSPRPSSRLRLARRPVFASPVVPSSPRRSSLLRLVVTPPSPRPPSRLCFVVAASSPRRFGIVCVLQCLFLTNPLAATHLLSPFFCSLTGTGRAVLLHGYLPWSGAAPLLKIGRMAPKAMHHRDFPFIDAIDETWGVHSRKGLIIVSARPTRPPWSLSL
ncbi:uncharacterized protein LOC130695664 [Daphnia carinata]|uniref:uncharacterized protein LOC130695664 n=1 Tax=Daphnia carinata TaxID=120202 RepID=UPI00286900E7|nr:uncharacterized protein LOC130695664 [Daphnia carinata]